MGISKMKKVYVAFTGENKKDILSILQNEGILHITRIKDTEKNEIARKIDEEREIKIAELESNITRIKKALNYIQSVNGNNLIKGKFIIEEKEYNRIANRDYPELLIDRVERHTERISFLNNEIKSINREIEFYKPWKKLKLAVEDVKNTKHVNFFIGTIPERNIDTIENFEYEIISQIRGKVFLIMASHIDEIDNAKSILGNNEFEHIDFGGMKGHINHNISEFERSKLKAKQEIRKINEEDLKLKQEIRTLFIFLDYYNNEFNKLEEDKKLIATNKAFIINGWIEEDKYKFLKKRLGERDDCSVLSSEMDEDEQPPIKLKNNRFFRPFEILTELYGMPYYYELDPSPLMSLFFAVFFGLCLTDAGYGIVLSIVLLGYMIKKKDFGNRLINLLFIGSLFTFVEGWLLHGWFGDLFTNYFNINIPYWFDPLKNSMAFVSLALMAGIIQIFTGIIIDFIEKLRSKDYIDALTKPFAWLILLGSIFAILFAGNALVDFGLTSRALLPDSVVPVAKILILITALNIILFSNRHEKNWGFRIFMGFLNLTIVNGLTSYLGDLLSYIRLVALGLVTAGIGVAVNSIAFMTSSIPVVGIVFTVLILLAGHTFNIAINVLGGFVHTLRLQYVEYFSKFYIGGGRAFSPLRRETKYILIK